MHNYKDIFTTFQKGLFEYGSKNRSKNMKLSQIKANLDEYKGFETRTLSDDDYYEILVFVAFYSGFKASTVASKRNIIRKHFPNIQEVANYDGKDINRVLDDKEMIKNRKKIEACVYNAQKMREIIQKHGSFNKYIETFDAL